MRKVCSGFFFSENIKKLIWEPLYLNDRKIFLAGTMAGRFVNLRPVGQCILVEESLPQNCQHLAAWLSAPLTLCSQEFYLPKPTEVLSQLQWNLKLSSKLSPGQLANGIPKELAGNHWNLKSFWFKIICYIEHAESKLPLYSRWAWDTQKQR